MMREESRGVDSIEKTAITSQRSPVIVINKLRKWPFSHNKLEIICLLMLIQKKVSVPFCSTNKRVDFSFFATKHYIKVLGSNPIAGTIFFLYFNCKNLCYKPPTD